jgi:ABC-2 type transport system ATP-binding protein
MSEGKESVSGSERHFAIEAVKLSRRFGELRAVDEVDLRVPDGAIVGLLGPNGAGKTTLVKMLTTLLAPTSGTATVAGFDVAQAPARVRRTIGYVPQMVSADGNLTGFENLLLSARLYGIPTRERAARIADALQFMELSESARKLVKTYSGGMIRRLELAQAMLHRPRVLFLDEPTIGLDPLARRTVWDRLKRLRREHGMTVLITTHDMEEADELCDELAIMHRGRIAAFGAPASLKAQVGPKASLGDVFAHFSGDSIQEGGNYRDVRQTRTTAGRLE